MLSVRRWSPNLPGWLRRLYWIGILLVGWFVLVAGSCGGYEPPQPPSPSPETPSPPPANVVLRVVDGRITPDPGQGATVCCDNPLDPWQDEGLADGWSAPTAKAIDRLKAAGAGWGHIRLGPYSDVGAAYLEEGERSVRDFEARGMYVLVDAWDYWALANGVNLFGLRCSDTHAAPPQAALDWMREVGRRFGKYERAFFEVGNEAFRCAPSPDWENGLIAALRSGLTDGPRLVGSQFFRGELGLRDNAAAAGTSHAITFDMRAHRRNKSGYGEMAGGSVRVEVAPQIRPIFDFVIYGAYPVGLDAPCSIGPSGVPAIIEEDDGALYTSDQWRRLNERCKGVGTKVIHWRGQRAWWEESDFLGAPLPVTGLVDCQTPPTGPELCSTGGGAFLQVVGDASAAAVKAHPELYRIEADGPYTKDRPEEMLHIQYVSEAVRKRGLCAGTYWGEEIGVMAPGDRTQSENYDLIRGDGRVIWGYRATCRPGTIVGGASDAVNGPWRGDPPSPPPIPPPRPAPSASPTTGCPPEAPGLSKIRIEGRRLASLIVDATPMAHDSEFCAPVNGRLDCPFGAETPEGMAQRQACELRHAPYRWSFQAITCSDTLGYGPCWLNADNPLQIRVAGPTSTIGVAQVCANDGRCWRADCATDNPVCVAIP